MELYSAGSLPASTRRGTRFLVLLGAVFLAVVLFLLIPLTQMLQTPQKADVTLREMQMIAFAPPKAPPAREQNDPEKEVEPPKLKESSQELDLSQLELSLNPGIGDALAMGVGSFRLESEVDILDQIQQVFQFHDLESVPSMIASPRFDYPKSLIRRGIRKGTVELLIRIDVKGNAIVIRVVSSPHEDLTRVAKNLVERSRFTIPEIDGRPVMVDGNLPLTLKAPRI